MICQSKSALEWYLEPLVNFLFSPTARRFRSFLIESNKGRWGRLNQLPAIGRPFLLLCVTLLNFSTFKSNVKVVLQTIIRSFYFQMDVTTPSLHFSFSCREPRRISFISLVFSVSLFQLKTQVEKLILVFPFQAPSTSLVPPSDNLADNPRKSSNAQAGDGYLPEPAYKGFTQCPFIQSHHKAI